VELPVILPYLIYEPIRIVQLNPFSIFTLGPDPEICGDLVYEAKLNGEVLTRYSYPFAFDAASMRVFMKSEDPLDVGTKNLTFSAYLGDYPEVKSRTVY